MNSEANNSPNVSVIIPTFNGASYISQAVSSALMSRDVSVEVIVIDDQSTDDTWRILEGFAGKIRHLRQDRGGPYKARNLGARHASGEWLAFLDADDDWLPEKLAKQLGVADENTALVYTDRINIGDCIRVAKRQSDAVDLYEGDIFELLLLGNFVTLSSVIIRRDWFERLGGFSESHIGVQDWDLWLRCASHGDVVKLVREPLTRYRIHDNQMSSNLDERASDRWAVVQRALHTERGQQVSWKMARQALANVWVIGAWDAMPTHPRKAIAWYLRAAYYWPWNKQLYKGILKCCLGRM